MKIKFRNLSRVLFLVAFIMMFAVGKAQGWLIAFGLGTVLSLVFSRLYCGWVCPMNTLFRPIEWLYRKTGWRRLETPKILLKPAVRYGFLVLVLGTMLVLRRLGHDLPVPAILTGLAVLVTLFFEESFWHNTICPYGTILNLSSRKAVRSVKIAEDDCIACGKCQKVCPVLAIATLDTGKRRISKPDCLSCHSCEVVCPTKAIGYR
jgi:polyferredoxin